MHKCINYLMNVPVSEPVLVPVLHKPLTGIDHEDTSPGICILLVKDHNTGRDTSPVKKIRWQTDNPLDNPFQNKIPPDFPLTSATEENTMRKNNGPFPGTLQ